MSRPQAMQQRNRMQKRMMHDKLTVEDMMEASAHRGKHSKKKGHAMEQKISSKKK